jgi:hypothetical protein
MNDLWEKHLPAEYRSRVVRPIAFEQHTEQSANAVRIVGFDADGVRCFECHSFVLTEDGFDADEFPIRYDVYYERVFAWRLRDGRWIRVKSYADRLDSCNKRLTTLPVEVTGVA